MKKNISFVLLVIIFFSVLLFHKSNLNSFPSKIHAWSQSDRYALAIGFTKNDFDFFHPQTLNQTESPDHKLIPKETAITAVDFPINEYIVAFMMKIFGTNAPWCFRIFTLLYSLFGLFFLFLLANKILKIEGLSLFVVLFCLTSPVYLYYQVGFLPSIPAISNLFVGLYFMFRHAESNKSKHFYYGLFFFTLAVLIRKPFLIFLIALTIYELFKTLKSKIVSFRIVLSFIVSYGLIFSYYLYNKHLEHKYGAAFLGELLPPHGISHALEITKTVIKNWIFQYLTQIHYILLIALIFISAVFLFKNKFRIEINSRLLYFISGLSFLGFLVYYIVMMRQYPNHDYYFLDSFYPVLCLLLILLLSFIRIDPKYSNTISFICTLFFILILFTVNAKTQHKREEVGFWDRVEITRTNFIDSEKFLDDIGIPKDSKILVIGSYTANAPFILMNRFGYAMMSYKPDDIKKALTWNYDFVVMQDCFTLSEIVSNYPPILTILERIAGNGKISVYKKRTTNNASDLLSFVGLDNKFPIHSSFIDFDSHADSCWQNIDSKLISDSIHGNVGFLTDSLMFSTTLSLKDALALTSKQRTLCFKMDVYSKENLGGSRVACSVEEQSKMKYFNAYDLEEMVDTLSKWKQVNIVFPLLPQLNDKRNELKVFIWNDGRHRFYYDNIKVSLY